MKPNTTPDVPWKKRRHSESQKMASMEKKINNNNNNNNNDNDNDNDNDDDDDAAKCAEKFRIQ